MNDASRRHVLAHPLSVLLYRHEAACSALRLGLPIEAQLPTSYELARAVVVRRTTLSLYRSPERAV